MASAAEHLPEFDPEISLSSVEAGNEGVPDTDREVENLDENAEAGKEGESIISDSSDIHIDDEAIASGAVYELVIDAVLAKHGGTREECEIDRQYEGQHAAYFNETGEQISTISNTSTIEDTRAYWSERESPEAVEQRVQLLIQHTENLNSNRNKLIFTEDSRQIVDGKEEFLVGLSICDSEGRVYLFDVKITPAEKPQEKGEEEMGVGEGMDVGAAAEQNTGSENTEPELDLDSEQRQSLVMEAQAEADATAVVDTQVQAHASEKVLTEKLVELFAEDEAIPDLVTDSSLVDGIDFVAPAKILEYARVQTEAQLYHGKEQEFQVQEIQADKSSDTKIASVVSEQPIISAEITPSSQHVEFSESITDDADGADGIKDAPSTVEMVSGEENIPEISAIKDVRIPSKPLTVASPEATIAKTPVSKVESSAEPVVPIQDAVEPQESVPTEGVIEEGIKNMLTSESKGTKAEVRVVEIEEGRVELIEDQSFQYEDIKIERMDVVIDQAIEVQTETEDVMMVSVPITVSVSAEIKSEASAEREQTINVEVSKVSEPNSSLSREIQNMRPEFTGIKLIETSRGPASSVEYTPAIQEEASREAVVASELVSNMDEEAVSSIAYVTPESGVVFTNEYLKSGRPRGVYVSDDVAEAANDNQTRVSSRDGITLRIAA